MKKVFLLFVCISFFYQGFSQANDKKMEWWKEAKFSMFIHWGLYSVPAAISWSNKLKAGETRTQMASNCDWMPPLTELCKIDLDTSDLDGKGLIPIIENNTTTSRHAAGFCWLLYGQWASWKGDWKLIGNPKIREEKEFAPEDSLFLVNLKDDPGKMTNLAAKYPEKVNELLRQYEKWLETNQ